MRVSPQVFREEGERPMSPQLRMTENVAMNSASAPLLADALDSRAPAKSGGPFFVTSAPAWPVAILGVPFDHVTIGDAISRIEGMIATRQPHYVVTANVDFLVQAHQDVELRRILLEADLVLCDGTPLVWASRWLGNALPERVAGSDLAPGLIRAAAAKGHRLFFLGAGPGVAAEAEAKLKKQYPTLNIVGTYSPPFSGLLEMDHAEITRRVRAANPDILLVSFGCPKQEKWIAMHHRALGVPVSIGVGATIDFLAGKVKRAPDWMRHTGTEWIYRLLQEPKRLYRRYANDLFYFVPTLATQWGRLAFGGEGADQPHEATFAVPEWRCLHAGSRLTRRSLEQDAGFWRGVTTGDAHCLIDLSNVRRVDGTGVAFLIRCRKQLHAQGRQLVLLAPSPALRRTLAAMRLADHFQMASNVTEATQRAESLVAHHVTQRDGTTRSLAWSGEIVAANVDDVWRMTTDHVATFAANKATLIIIDLARLRFIDSSGAALMLRLKKWAQQVPTEIIFAHPQPNVRNVLRLTRLDHLLLEGAQ
jgi:N-acetylglucosaminyldiphosphoundecaprenol N-acetyl-beta-D-mannosaminyltransferase